MSSPITNIWIAANRHSILSPQGAGPAILKPAPVVVEGARVPFLARRHHHDHFRTPHLHCGRRHPLLAAVQPRRRCAARLSWRQPGHLGIWAYGTGAGWLGAIVTGLLGAGLTLAVGQALLILVRPVWARLLIALAFVAPAGMAGFYATLGITRQMMPSETWQIIFAVIGAVAVGITAFLRVAGMAATDPADGIPARG